MSAPFDLLLIDDHPLLRRGLAELFEASGAVSYTHLDVYKRQLHHRLQVVRVDHLEVAVPAIGKLGAAVADQLAELLGPADQVLRMVGVAVHHVHRPATFGQGALGLSLIHI